MQREPAVLRRRQIVTCGAIARFAGRLRRSKTEHNSGSNRDEPVGVIRLDKMGPRNASLALQACSGGTADVTPVKCPCLGILIKSRATTLQAGSDSQLTTLEPPRLGITPQFPLFRPRQGNAAYRRASPISAVSSLQNRFTRLPGHRGPMGIKRPKCHGDDQWIQADFSF